MTDDELQDLFEGIAKTNTKRTQQEHQQKQQRFEGIAKTNTKRTMMIAIGKMLCLRVLLKQIQNAQVMLFTVS